MLIQRHDTCWWTLANAIRSNILKRSWNHDGKYTHTIYFLRGRPRRFAELFVQFIDNGQSIRCRRMRTCRTEWGCRGAFASSLVRKERAQFNHRLTLWNWHMSTCPQTVQLLNEIQVRELGDLLSETHHFFDLGTNDVWGCMMFELDPQSTGKFLIQFLCDMAQLSVRHNW